MPLGLSRNYGSEGDSYPAPLHKDASLQHCSQALLSGPPHGYPRAVLHPLGSTQHSPHAWPSLGLCPHGLSSSLRGSLSISWLLPYSTHKRSGATGVCAGPRPSRQLCTACPVNTSQSCGTSTISSPELRLKYPTPYVTSLRGHWRDWLHTQHSHGDPPSKHLPPPVFLTSTKAITIQPGSWVEIWRHDYWLPSFPYPTSSPAPNTQNPCVFPPCPQPPLQYKPLSCTVLRIRPEIVSQPVSLHPCSSSTQTVPGSQGGILKCKSGPIKSPVKTVQC